MIAMRPIEEPDVLALLNDGRFEGAVRGYVVMEGPQYHGHMLYRVEDGVTEVLECGVDETPLVDGAVRACIAAGQNAGADSFGVRQEDPKLAEWFRVFCKNISVPVPVTHIFTPCGGPA